MHIRLLGLDDDLLFCRSSKKRGAAVGDALGEDGESDDGSRRSSSSTSACPEEVPSSSSSSAARRAVDYGDALLDAPKRCLSRRHGRRKFVLAASHSLCGNGFPAMAKRARMTNRALAGNLLGSGSEEIGDEREHEEEDEANNSSSSHTTEDSEEEDVYPGDIHFSVVSHRSSTLVEEAGEENDRGDAIPVQGGDGNNVSHVGDIPHASDTQEVTSEPNADSQAIEADAGRLETNVRANPTFRFGDPERTDATCFLNRQACIANPKVQMGEEMFQPATMHDTPPAIFAQLNYHAAGCYNVSSSRQRANQMVQLNQSSQILDRCMAQNQRQEMDHQQLTQNPVAPPGAASMAYAMAAQACWHHYQRQASSRATWMMMPSTTMLMNQNHVAMVSTPIQPRVNRMVNNAPALVTMKAPPSSQASTLGARATATCPTQTTGTNMAGHCRFSSVACKRWSAFYHGAVEFRKKHGHWYVSSKKKNYVSTDW